MEWFVQNNAVLNEATDPKQYEQRDAVGFRESMDAVQDLRQFYRETGQDGWLYGKGWKHVASIHVPVFNVGEVLDPELLRNKKRFYRWLDAHPGYCTYDRRRAARRGDMMVFSDGKAIV